MSIRRIIFLLFFGLTACKPFPFSTSSPTTKPFTINLSPDLAWMQEPLKTCAADLPETVVIIHYKSPDSLQDVDLTITLGNSHNEDIFQAFLIGNEKIILIANPTINIESLTQLGIQDAYLSLNPQMQAWGYPASNPINDIFSNTILEGGMFSPHVGQAPNATAMLEAIADNSRAIGYIPQTWLTDDVQVIPLEPDQENALTQPILGITDGPPSGISQALLGCLQGATQP